MIEAMSSEERVRELLRRVPAASEVAAYREDNKIIALVVSTVFAEMEEYERQVLVWNILLENLADSEQAEVGYVFTNTPDEKARAQAEAASGR